MYIIKTILNIKEFETKEEVVEYLWGAFFRNEEDIVVLDSYDHQRVDIEEFREVFWQLRKAQLKKWYGKKNYVFRRGPVPGIRKNWMAGGPRSTYRKYKQELTSGNYRAKRGNLLRAIWDGDSWWRKNERNWKSQRKTQWKAK